MESNKCRFCQEPINMGAKKCPHCGCWQSKWKLSLQNPVLLLSVAIAIILIMYPVLYTIDTQLYTYFKQCGEETADSQEDKKNIFLEQLKIINTTQYEYEYEGRKYIAVLGEIMNDSEFILDSVHIQIDFYNSNNELVETIYDNDRDYILPAKSKAAFDMSIYVAKDISEYKTHKVYIRWAYKKRFWSY